VNGIKVVTVIGEDRRLVIELPDEIPAGQVEVVVRSLEADARASRPLTREAARARLQAAGILSTAHHAPEGTVPLSLDERKTLGTLPLDARPTSELIDEDRGAY
jgi:hypothetical protein